MTRNYSYTVDYSNKQAEPQCTETPYGIPVKINFMFLHIKTVNLNDWQSDTLVANSANMRHNTIVRHSDDIKNLNLREKLRQAVCEMSANSKQVTTNVNSDNKTERFSDPDHASAFCLLS